MTAHDAGATAPPEPRPGPAAPSAVPAAGASPREPRAGRRVGALLVGTALVAGGVGGGAVYGLGRAVAPDTCDVAGVARSVLPGVVTVLVDGAVGNGSGSGAILTRDGTIVTNDHVIAAAAAGGGRISVVLSSGETEEATLVGTDAKTDLAVLRVEATDLPTVALGEPTALSVGQQVVALGAPLGLSGTVTSGIVSALDRDISAPTASGGTTVLAGTIQTDASINPGNSGGPLVDCAGRLVGINTVIATVPDASGTAGGGNVGIGFAVPAGTVRRITDELVQHGRATHPWLGLTLREIPAEVLPPGVEGGLFVQGVTAGGPGAKAGVAPGDAIVAIGGGPATSFTKGRLLATAAVGDPVELTILRQGARGTAWVTLAEAPGA